MIEDCDGSRSSKADRNAKKVRFKETEGEEGIDMVVDLSPEPTLSWKDRLLGKGSLERNNVSTDSYRVFKEDFNLLDRDITRSMVNEVLSIPWTPDFSPSQSFPNVVITWIRLLGLSGFLCKRKILEEIVGLFDQVTKPDYNIDSRSRGRFSRMAIFLNLDKPLLPDILVWSPEDPVPSLGEFGGSTNGEGEDTGRTCQGERRGDIRAMDGG
ncbi:hypothetical protein Goshw_012977 [Gossypium schwendimanii]|uniref:DUF4283 domain-containing protein n=1 Tax=Gossypium schwendimanii TaxID=34291 RepID=A0A7J9MTC0_GOSSC|nr:hypothetical protein [Gossypium schwendimanii]